MNSFFLPSRQSEIQMINNFIEYLLYAQCCVKHRKYPLHGFYPQISQRIRKWILWAYSVPSIRLGTVTNYSMQEA